MSDLEKFIALYKSIGIHKVPVKEDGKQVIRLEADGDYSSKEKLIGYPGFFSVIQFDATGKFINQGFWE